MTRDEKLKGVKTLAPWFHCIDLGDGVLTKSASLAGEHDDHPRPTWNVIRRFLPEDLSGQEVLDVGCNAGFYAIEAKRRAASRVLGVEAKRLHVRQARFAQRALSLDIKYQRGSVYDLRAATFGRFDVTLALGLIYHCKHLMLALENLAQVTRHLMILETAVFPPDRNTKPFQRVYGANDQRVHTLGYVENAPDALEASYNWFLPSVDSLPALIRQGGFEEAEVVDMRGTRAVCVCRKSGEAPDSSAPNRLRAAISLDRERVTCGPGDSVRFPGPASRTPGKPPGSPLARAAARRAWSGWVGTSAPRRSRSTGTTGARTCLAISGPARQWRSTSRCARRSARAPTASTSTWSPSTSRGSRTSAPRSSRPRWWSSADRRRLGATSHPEAYPGSDRRFSAALGTGRTRSFGVNYFGRSCCLGIAITARTLSWMKPALRLAPGLSSGHHGAKALGKRKDRWVGRTSPARHASARLRRNPSRSASRCGIGCIVAPAARPAR